MTVVASNYARVALDLYQTEPWATRALLKHFPVAGLTVWEPAAGNHLMADVFKDAGAAKVFTSDIATYDREHDFTGNFFDDAVVKFNAVIYAYEHEQPAVSERRPRVGGSGYVGEPPRGDYSSVSRGQTLSETDGGTVQGDPVGVFTGLETALPAGEVQGAVGQRERSVQGWNARDGLSQHDRKGSLQLVREHKESRDPSQGREPHEQRSGQPGNSVLPVPFALPQTKVVGRPKAQCIVTNPPYGKGNRDAVKFAELALERCDGLVALLLTAKFDFGNTRTHLFRDNPRFRAKIALIDRLSWTLNGATGTEDHAWYVWSGADGLTPEMFWEGRS